MNTARKPRLRPQAKSLLDAVRDFLTPQVFKQARKAGSRRKSPSLLGILRGYPVKWGD